MDIYYIAGLIVFIVGLLFVVPLILGRREAGGREGRSERDVQCFECLGSTDSRCASSCSLPT